jgi:phenylacetate-coenzyme A ligase PaaK-like adenylate-forming protein
MAQEIREKNIQDLKDKGLDYLLKLKQYSLNDEEKNKILLDIMKFQIKSSINNNKYIKNFFKRNNADIQIISSVEQIPPMPVQMFKYFDMATCPKDRIVRILKSSGTTSKFQSKVPLSKVTIMNQIKGINSILSDYLGQKRKIFLVIDHVGVNSQDYEISARTAGVRGLSMRSKKIFYLLIEESGKLKLNIPVINDLINNYGDEDIYAFGFTFIVWSIFFKQMEQSKLKLNFKNAKVFHSGGWKKLKEQQVSKEELSEGISRIFGTDKSKIYDFYGMAEQTGVIFVDCENKNKHVPNFSQIIIRNYQTLKPCKIGEVGLIEVMSVLSDSYYCQAILTEDLGYVLGIDDCPCGRKGRYFRFTSRMEKVEIRGCGDTFREK